jgi:hypothetical protein
MTTTDKGKTPEKTFIKFVPTPFFNPEVTVLQGCLYLIASTDEILSLEVNQP